MLIPPIIGQIFVQKLDPEFVLILKRCCVIFFICTKIRPVCEVTGHFDLKLILIDLGKEKSNQTKLMNDAEKLDLNPHLVEFISLSFSQHLVDICMMQPKGGVICSCSS